MAAAINPPLNLLIPSPSPPMLLPRDLTHKTSPLTLDRPLFSRRCDCPRVPLNPISTRASASPAFNCLNSISHQDTCLGHHRSNTCHFNILFIITIIVNVFSP